MTKLPYGVYKGAKKVQGDNPPAIHVHFLPDSRQMK